MPKVLDKPHNPAALLLPKRAPAKQPQGEQSFDHALKRAQPKREPDPAPQARKDEAPAAETAIEAPVDPGNSDTVNENDIDSELAPKPVESDEPAPDASVDEQDPGYAEVDSDVALPVLDQPNLPIVQLPQQISDPTTVQTSEITTPAEIALSPIQIDVLPQSTEKSDAPQDEPQADAARVSVQPVALDIATDDEPLPQGLQLPAQERPATATAVRPVNEPQQLANVELPDTAIESTAAVDSDQPQTDDGATNPEQPKLKAPTIPIDSEYAAQPTSPQGVPVMAVAKDAPVQSDATRAVDAPVAKVSVDAKPATLEPLPLPPAPVRTDADFAAGNHERIVSSVRTQLLPNGGSMHIRLDPPELGALQIHVRMVDGVMQASFETSSDQATRLLSHTLSQLKSALETQGIAVDKLQVQQAPREHQANAGRDDPQRQSQQQDSQAQREQQRRELMNRMWRRMRLGRDPLDMVA